MVTTTYLEQLYSRHLEHLIKKEILNISNKEKDILIKYFSNITFLMQFYNDVDIHQLPENALITNYVDDLSWLITAVNV